MREGADDAVVAADGAADPHERAPYRLPQGDRRHDGCGEALGVGVAVGRVGRLGGSRARRGRHLSQLVAALVDPRRTDTRKAFAARQRLQRIFGGRDELAALQPRRGGRLLLQTRRFAGQRDIRTEPVVATDLDTKHGGTDANKRDAAR